MRYTPILLIIFSSAVVLAQGKGSSTSNYNIGIGFGVDYGGFGLRGTYTPIPAVGLFGAAGYNLDALGWNVGAQYLIPVNKNYFFFTGMYGYNTVLAVEGLINDKATYYGVSGGIGYQVVNRDGSRHWNFEVLVPVRSSNFDKDVNALKAMGATVADPSPLLISVGYHFRH
jgi:hypothetical protein